MRMAMFDEDDLLPISALLHLLFCERQCALIHIEQLWEENRLTVEGRHLHERADDGRRETRGARRIARALPLRSLRLGLSGRADVVEFHDDGGVMRAFPVEYKRGQPKLDRSDEVQLCAQAICLEEMLGLAIPGGALFYGTTRRRTEVPFDAELRAVTETAAARLHALISAGITPPAVRAPKCDGCSLLDVCLPAPALRARSASEYIERVLSRALTAETQV